MKNTQLLKMLGEIDNKFLDEALGGDSEKPLKIDTSRTPIKWYRIAAPIAACLVLGAGILTLSRFFNRSDPIKPPITPDDPISLGFVSANEADLDACKQILLEKDPDIDGFSTRIMDINFDGIDEAVLKANGGNVPGMYIFSKYDDEMLQTGFINNDPLEYGLSDLDELMEYDPSAHLEAGNHYWYFHYKGEHWLRIYAEAVARITYDGTEYGIDYPVAAYGTGYTYGRVDEVRLLKNWSRLSELKGDDDVNMDIEVSLNEFASLWDKHIPFEELNAILSCHLNEDGDPFKLSVGGYFADLDLDAIPLLDSADFDPAQSNIIKRARIAETSVCPDSGVRVALVGENIFRLAEDGKEYMRMDKLSVIYYHNAKLYAQVYLDPVTANNGEGHGNIIIRAKEKLPFKSYHIDDDNKFHIIVIGDEDFMLTDEPCCSIVVLSTPGTLAKEDTSKLMPLKGIYDSGYTTVSHISTSNRLVELGNSLYDTKTGVNFAFFPEMFNYADPDADHSHFKCATMPLDDVAYAEGGIRYNFDDDDQPTLGTTPQEALGTQEDLSRFRDFILSGDIAVVHATTTNKTGRLSDVNATRIINMIKNAEFGTFSEFPNPPAGGRGGTAGEFYIYGCGSDGSVLFTLYHNVAWVSVVFGDCQTRYLFDDINKDIDQIFNFNYLGYNQ